jgi:hypothetical protein
VSDCRFSSTILSCQTRLTSSFLLTTAGDAVISAIIMSKDAAAEPYRPAVGQDLEKRPNSIIAGGVAEANYGR